MRRRRTSSAPHLALSAGIVAALVLSRALFRFATMQVEAARSLVGPLDLFLTSLVAAALVWLAVDLIESRRLARPRVRLLACRTREGSSRWSTSRWACSMRRCSGRTAAFFNRSSPARPSTCCTFRCIRSMPRGSGSPSGSCCSTRPSSGPRPPSFARRRFCGGCRGAGCSPWRRRAGPSARSRASRSRERAIPQSRRCPSSSPLPRPAVVRCRCRSCACAPGACRSRCGSPGLFLALLVPAIAMYPSLSAFAIQAKERLIANEYGAQVIAQRDDLQQRLQRALDQIDALPRFRSSSRRRPTKKWRAAPSSSGIRPSSRSIA